MTWLSVWMRAVIAPAYRRAGAVWVGSAIVAAVVFGPTAMQPSDLTGLALHVPGVAAVLAITWLLLYLPTARMLMRPDGVAYLAALPSPQLAPRLLTIGALVLFQLPWLLLWLIGEHARGVAIVVGWTVVIVLLAIWQPRPRTPRAPRWTTNLRALAAIYARALSRRASDALVRAAGLAVLAGLLGGLMIRNNGASGPHAAVLATSALTIVLVPGWAGVLLPLVETRRQASWLVHSLGHSRGSRVLALLLVIAAVYVVTVALAVIAASVVGASDLATSGLLAIVALSCSVGAACLSARAVLHADAAASDDPRDLPRRSPAAARVVVGAVAGAALIVFALVWLGIVGTAAVLAVSVAGLVTARNA